MNILIDAAVTFEKLKPNDKAYVMGYMQACLNKKTTTPGPETVEPVAEPPVAPSSSIAPVALPEKEPFPETPVAPETSPVVAPYRFVLNVPEFKDYKDKQ